MNEDKTQPELVWYNGRWFLKSVVDRVTAEREAEKAEAKRVLLANVEASRAVTREARAAEKAEKEKAQKERAERAEKEKAEKEKARVSGPANPSPKPILSDPPSLRYGVASQIKAEA